MKGIFLVLAMSLFCVCSASAQHYVVPSGTVWPDGGSGYLAPVGAPFHVRTHDILTAPQRYYASPLYWVPAPYISVPVGQPSPPSAR